jgi:hypothetical protein
LKASFTFGRGKLAVIDTLDSPRSVSREQGLAAWLATNEYLVEDDFRVNEGAIG